MKSSLSNSMMILAGVATLFAAQPSFAETKVVARIPFEFRTAGATMPAGDYELAPGSAAGGRRYFIIKSATGGRGVISVPLHALDARGDFDSGKIVFRCTGRSACSVEEVWTSGETGWRFKAPALTPAEKERQAVVYFRTVDVGQ